MSKERQGRIEEATSDSRISSMHRAEHGTVLARKERGQLSLAWMRLRRNRLALVGLTVLSLIILMAIFAPLVAPFDPIQQNRQAPLEPPNTTHFLGTDNFGRDVLSRTIHGSRPTLLIGLSTVLLAGVVGIPIGLTAGYRGGTVDSVLMRVMDAVLSFPSIILALALLATLGPSTRNVVIAIAIVYTPTFARLARGSTLAVREEDYVLAANSIGVPSPLLLARHILPNIAAPLLVQAAVNFATAIIAAATLSFLGLGTQPPMPDWGRDISVGRDFIRTAWWLIVSPAAAMSVTVLAINFLGDGLRDALDPTTRRD
jgi:ABC-type dipeptide/oligopeptide/nickel transport system permease subunit